MKLPLRGELELEVELIVDAQIVDAPDNRMAAIDDSQIPVHDHISAVRPAMTSAHEVAKQRDISGLRGHDSRVKCHDPRAAPGQLAHGGRPLRIGPDPLGALPQIEDHGVRLPKKRGTLGPRTVGRGHLHLELRNLLQASRQHVQSGHVLVSPFGVVTFHAEQQNAARCLRLACRDRQQSEHQDEQDTPIPEHDDFLPANHKS